MDVGPGDFVAAIYDSASITKGRIYTLARVERGEEWVGCQLKDDCVAPAFWLCEIPTREDDPYCGCAFKPVRRPPIDAITRILTQPIPADAESVPA